MNRRLVDEIAAAVLYEGYILYPYRPSALKNRQRFNFGVVSPRGDRQTGDGGWCIRTECLVRAAGTCELEVNVRFLQLTSRTGESPAWQEAIERDVPSRARLDDLCAAPVRQPFGWPAEPGVHGSLAGEIEVSAWRAAEGVFKIAVRIANLTPGQARGLVRDALIQHALLSTHAVLHVENGEFVSLLDPPADVQAAAAGCHNAGLWPVLVGDEADRDAVLASPIILYDHPRIAAESAGDFFDGTEIDEMLVLRILTMTDEEKREMRDGDPRARHLLDRTETLPPDNLMRLHGVLRIPSSGTGTPTRGGGSRDE